MTVYINNPFPIFLDKNGNALENGYIYIGRSNLNPEIYPVDVFYDAGLTIPAPNPVRTINGYPSRNGTPAQIFTAQNCSITVKDKQKNLIFNAAIVYNQGSISINLDTVDNLRGLIGFNGQVVNTLGYYAIGDEGGNRFRFDSSNTDTDNGGTIIKPTFLLGAGRWVAVQSELINIKQFGIKNDGATDNTVAFQKLATFLSSLTKFVLTMPAGTYINSTYFRVQSSVLTHATINADDAEYVVTAPTPIVGGYFEVTNTLKTGLYLTINGLIARMNRATVRTGNVDMVRVRGFKNYVINNICIPSSDNNGLSVGRSDGSFVPDSLQIIAPVIGGRVTTGDSHAPIGDTGIWMNCAAKVTHITSPQINGTGDDGILIGHATEAESGGCYITNCDIRNCGAAGISLSAPRGVVTGRITRTNNAGVFLTLLDTKQAADIHVQVDMQEIGYLQAGEIGTNIIPKSNPHAIYINTGGVTGGNFNLTGSSVNKCYGRGILIQPSATYGGNISKIYGSSIFMREIGKQESGTITADTAVIYRSSVGGNAACSDVDLQINVEETSVPLINWVTSSTSDDNNLNFRFIAKKCVIDASFLNTYLMQFTQTSTGRPTNVTINLDLIDCVFGTLLRVPIMTGAELEQFDVFGLIDGSEFNVSRASYNLGNNNSARHLKSRTFQCIRNVTTSSLLAELDPTETWVIEAAHVIGAAAMGATGAYYKAVWSPDNSSLPTSLSSSVLNIISNVVGTNSTGFEVAYNSGSTTFANGALEVRGKSSGFGLGAIRAIMIATSLTDGASASLN